MRKKSLMTIALVPFLWACEDTTGPEGAGEVAVRFQAVAPSRPSAQLAATSNASFDHVPATGAITLTGSNGTLVIQDLRLIVSELELKRFGVQCAEEEDDDGCEKFEDGPFLVSALNGGVDEVVKAVVPAGTYSEFEFEIEDLEDDGDDDGSPQARQAILAEIRQAYPSFPRDASMVVHGTFNGQPFTVYFEAEIEVEEEFRTPFRVPEDGVITVNLDPAAWFQQGGRVMDLRALNGRTIEFEAEFENGIAEVKFDD